MWDYRYLIVAIVFLILVALCEWNRTKQTAYNVMLRAKDMAKDEILKGGKEQEDWVVGKLMQILPAPITIFLGEKFIRQLVKFLYEKGLDYLDDGKFNNSVE